MIIWMFNNLGMNCFRCSVIVALIFLTSPVFVAEADQDKQGEYYPDSTFWGALIYASNDLEKSTVSGDHLFRKIMTTKTGVVFFYMFRTASVLVLSGQGLADMGIISTGHSKLGQLLSYLLYLSDNIFSEKS